MVDFWSVNSSFQSVDADCAGRNSRKSGTTDGIDQIKPRESIIYQPYIDFDRSAMNRQSAIARKQRLLNGTSSSRSVSQSRRLAAGLTRQMSLSAVVEAATGDRNDGLVVQVPVNLRPTISVRETSNYRVTPGYCVGASAADVGIVRGASVESDRMRWKLTDADESIDMVHLMDSGGTRAFGGSNIGKSSDQQRQSLYDALIQLKAHDCVKTGVHVTTATAAAATSVIPAAAYWRNRDEMQHRHQISWSKDDSSVDDVSCHSVVCVENSSRPSDDLHHVHCRQMTTLDSNGCEFIKKMADKAANTVVVTIFLGMFTMVPLAMASVGVKHLDDCPVQPNLPVYLLAGGCFGLLKVFSLLWRQVRSRRSQTMEDVIDDDDDDGGLQTGSAVGSGVSGGGILVSRSSKFSEFVLSVFLLIWFVCGNCWVFSVRQPIHFKQRLASPNDWCDRTVYMFALIQIIASYAVAGLVAIVVFMFAVCHRTWSLSNKS